MYFFDGGTFWELPLTYFYLPFSNLSKFLTSAAAPFASTPFVRDQGMEYLGNRWGIGYGARLRAGDDVRLLVDMETKTVRTWHNGNSLPKIRRQHVCSKLFLPQEQNKPSEVVIHRALGLYFQ